MGSKFCVCFKMNIKYVKHQHTLLDVHYLQVFNFISRIRKQLIFWEDEILSVKLKSVIYFSIRKKT